MIHEVDEVLKGLIGGGALSGSGIDVSFEVPTRDWAARRNAPVVKAYLYDVREDMARRQRGRTGVRDDHDIVVRHRRPPRWFQLSYLVTAWTKTPQDEHRLLSRCRPRCCRTNCSPPRSLRNLSGASATGRDGQIETREHTLGPGAAEQRRAFRVGEAVKVRFTVESAHAASAETQAAIAEIELFGRSGGDQS